MKTAIIAITLLMFSSKIHSQSLSFNDIENLYSKKVSKSILIKKGFKLEVANHPGEEVYVLKPRTDMEEKVWFISKGIGYWSLNAAYIQSLVKIARGKYRIMAEDSDIGFYNYGDLKISIAINISKNPGTSSTVSFISKR